MTDHCDDVMQWLLTVTELGADALLLVSCSRAARP